MLTEDQIRGFQNYLSDEEKSDNTIKKYLRDIRFFADWAGGRQEDKQLILEYKRYLCDKYAPSSVNSMLSSMNAFFAFTGRYELRIKTLKIQRRIFAPGSRNLTRHEYSRLLKTAKHQGREQLYLLIQTIGATGIRISEDIYCKG